MIGNETLDRCYKIFHLNGIQVISCIEYSYNPFHSDYTINYNYCDLQDFIKNITMEIILKKPIRYDTYTSSK